MAFQIPDRCSTYHDIKHFQQHVVHALILSGPHRNDPVTCCSQRALLFEETADLLFGSDPRSQDDFYEEQVEKIDRERRGDSFPPLVWCIEACVAIAGFS